MTGVRAEDKALADAVRQAAVALSAAICNAADAGLEVSVHVDVAHRIGILTDLTFVSAKVRRPV